MNSTLPHCCFVAFGVIACLTAPAAEGPLVVTATLSEARAAVAAIKARGPLPPGGLVVEISPGINRVNETITLTEADGGTAGSPVVWRAARGASVILSGGIALNEWRTRWRIRQCANACL